MTCRRFAVLVTGVLLLPMPAFSQVTTGAIAGIVRDQTGSALAGARVDVTSPALIEKSRTAITDGAGRYSIVELPSGMYDVTFTLAGFVTTRQVVELMARTLQLNRTFEYWESDEEFYRLGATTPRSNCVLDVTKLLKTGVTMRPVEEAMEHSLKNWQAKR